MPGQRRIEEHGLSPMIIHMIDALRASGVGWDEVATALGTTADVVEAVVARGGSALPRTHFPSGHASDPAFAPR